MGRAGEGGEWCWVLNGDDVQLKDEKMFVVAGDTKQKLMSPFY